MHVAYHHATFSGPGFCKKVLPNQLSSRDAEMMATRHQRVLARNTNHPVQIRGSVATKVLNDKTTPPAAELYPSVTSPTPSRLRTFAASQLFVRPQKYMTPLTRSRVSVPPSLTIRISTTWFRNAIHAQAAVS